MGTKRCKNKWQVCFGLDTPIPHECWRAVDHKPPCRCRRCGTEATRIPVPAPSKDIPLKPFLSALAILEGQYASILESTGASWEHFEHALGYCVRRIIGSTDIAYEHVARMALTAGYWSYRFTKGTLKGERYLIADPHVLAHEIVDEAIAIGRLLAVEETKDPTIIPKIRKT